MGGWGGGEEGRGPPGGRREAGGATSNAASERACGVLRGLEDPQRMSTREETVTMETLARCNAWVVEEVRRCGRCMGNFELV